MAFKKWNVKECDKARAKAICEQENVDGLTALLLSAKGITDPEKIIRFFADDYDWIDPFTLPDMDLAVERISIAIETGESIGIFGDFDADGVTSTALLYSYLHSVGCEVDYYIPDRLQEGYGLNAKAIDAFSEKGISLIITVDNGISAIDEVAYANEKGIDVVVTDHHLPGTSLPDAVAIVDAHCYNSECAYSDWAGVGVTFKLVSALNGDEEEILAKYADLICIGTVADIVPVMGENRYLIKKGLALLNHSERLGIVALKGAVGIGDKELTSKEVSYMLAPRINAAGRVGSADKAVRLLLTEDANEAIALAEEINDYNACRVQIETEMFEQAQAMLLDEQYRFDRVIVLCGKKWNSGVAGIVASRIVEKYGKPAIVIADNGETVLKGSCRSIEGFSIYEALSACCDSLVQFGGHTLAAGLSVKRENVETFRTLINDYAARMFRFMPTAQLNIDLKINPAYISIDTYNTLSRFEPFGMGNAKPLFAIFGAQLLSITPLSGRKHTKFTFCKNEYTFSALYFWHAPEQMPYREGDYLDLAFHIEKNEYLGNVKTSVILKEVRYNGMKDDSIINGLHIFNCFMCNDIRCDEARYIPTDRNNIAQIYRFIRDNNGWQFSVEALYINLKPVIMNYSQFLLSLEIMLEMDLLIFDEERKRYDIPIEPQKVDINQSRLLQKAKEILQQRKEG